MNAQGRSRPLALRRNALSILREKIGDPHRRVEGLIRGFGDAVEEEFEPRLPGAVLADFLQQAVIVGAMRLQIETEIEKRVAQHAIGAKEERHQKTANAAVAVEEGMDRLELDMEQTGFDQRRQARLRFMDEPLESVEAGVEFADRRRNE